MELSYLNEFVVLAQVCQFHEAAEMLFISQSSLSKHIKSVEAELGHELFDRSTRTVELSSFGKSFLPYATKIVQLQKDYTNDLLTQPNLSSKRVSIGVSPLVTLYNLWLFMPAFNKQFPDIQLEITEQRGQNVQLLDLLHKKQCDIVILESENPEPLTDSSVYSTLYTKDTLVALLPATHPLAKEASLVPSQIFNETVIQLGETDLLKLLDVNNMDASIHVSRGRMVSELVGKDMGVGILTKYSALYFATPSTVSVPFEHSPELYFHLYCLKSQKNNPVLNAIIGFVKSRQVSDE
ncbi:MAG: LysR family transcriptional regulator [Clostridiales bacterium]|nr:LysR family transcriptional regulator [Clostridiales bacterium]